MEGRQRHGQTPAWDAECTLEDLPLGQVRLHSVADLLPVNWQIALREKVGEAGWPIVKAVVGFVLTQDACSDLEYRISWLEILAMMKVEGSVFFSSEAPEVHQKTSVAEDLRSVRRAMHRFVQVFGVSDLRLYRLSGVSFGIGFPLDGLRMLDPEGRPVPPTSDIFSPESVRAFDTTTCFFDVYQTMQYIAYAGLMIYYCTIAANDVDFAADITGVQASVAWVASYLASAFSTCIGGLVAGDCVSNVAWTAGNFPQLASDALSIVGDCNSDNETERFEMISFFARFGLQVVTEMKDCAVVDTETAKMECAWGIIYAFDNFGWAVEYILQSINDCKEEGNVDVLCAEAIGDIVFSGTGMMPSVAWAYRDCRQRFRS
ncbi:hypothetical protein AK812_SmicGene7237 [Symbiodinium microadriaticum]|uniref:Uncharacterized protein n=2 Tax=Symbiodinium TaxID=2949 RepID=A0A1Q9EP45_SYMMI|nr:hypothetical protein AK812_SmicGene7237 [Symbiodinium microadriaticum]